MHSFEMHLKEDNPEKTNPSDPIKYNTWIQAAQIMDPSSGEISLLLPGSNTVVQIIPIHICNFEPYDK